MTRHELAHTDILHLALSAFSNFLSAVPQRINGAFTSRGNYHNRELLSGDLLLSNSELEVENSKTEVKSRIFLKAVIYSIWQIMTNGHTMVNVSQGWGLV